jgi:hypothetical protein
MGINDLIKEALELSPAERYRIIEALERSLDQPDPSIETLWVERALERAERYREGTLETVTIDIDSPRRR